MNVRPFIYEEDYDEFKSWWVGDRQICPPKESLPSIGIVVGENKFTGFLMDTDIDFMWLIWWLPNPKNTARETRESIEHYIDAGIQLTRARRKKYLFCFTDKRGMVKLLERVGFVKMGEGHFALKVA